MEDLVCHPTTAASRWWGLLLGHSGLYTLVCALWAYSEWLLALLRKDPLA